MNVRVTYSKNGANYTGVVNVAVMNKTNVELAMLKKGVGRSQIKAFVEAPVSSDK